MYIEIYLARAISLIEHVAYMYFKLFLNLRAKTHKNGNAA
jgi:hypothetical protein